MAIKLPQYEYKKYERGANIGVGRVASPPLGVWVKDGQSYYQKDLDRQFFCWEIDTQEYSVRGIPYGTLMTNNKGPGWWVAGQEVGEVLSNVCKYFEEFVERLPDNDKYRSTILIPIGLLGELAAAIERDNKGASYAQV